MKRTASAHWSGNLQGGAGNLTTASGTLSKTPYSFHSRFEQGQGTNPEELLAAAHAGCFTMALSMVLQQAGLTADSLDTNCVISLDKGDAGILHHVEPSRAESQGSQAPRPRRLRPQPKPPRPTARSRSSTRPRSRSTPSSCSASLKVTIIRVSPANHSLIVAPQESFKKGFFTAAGNGSLWKSGRSIGNGDGRCQGRRASRHPAVTNTTPWPRCCASSNDMPTVRASIAGCAWFPKRILRCRLATRLYYKEFAETRSCLLLQPYA